MVRLVDGQIVATDRATSAHDSSPECFGQRLSWWSLGALVVFVLVLGGGRGRAVVAIAALCYRAYAGGSRGPSAVAPPSSRIKGLGDLPPTPAAGG